MITKNVEELGRMLNMYECSPGWQVDPDFGEIYNMDSNRIRSHITPFSYLLIVGADKSANLMAIFGDLYNIVDEVTVIEAVKRQLLTAEHFGFSPKITVYEWCFRDDLTNEQKLRKTVEEEILFLESIKQGDTKLLTNKSSRRLKIQSNKFKRRFKERLAECKATMWNEDITIGQPVILGQSY